MRTKTEMFDTLETYLITAQQYHNRALALPGSDIEGRSYNALFSINYLLMGLVETLAWAVEETLEEEKE